MDGDRNFGNIRNPKSEFIRQNRTSNIPDLILRYNERFLDNRTPKQFDPNSENKMENNNGNLSKSQTDLTAGRVIDDRNFVMKPLLDQFRSPQNLFDGQSQNSNVDSDEEEEILLPPPLPPPPLCRQKKPIPVEDFPDFMDKPMPPLPSQPRPPIPKKNQIPVMVKDFRNLENFQDFMDRPLPPLPSQPPPSIMNRSKNQILHSPTRPSSPPPPVPILPAPRLSKTNPKFSSRKVETPDVVQIPKNPSFQEMKSMRLHEEPLYQFYDALIFKSICDEGVNSDVAIYENSQSIENTERQPISPISNKDVISLFRMSTAKSKSRTLWCERPEVIQSSLFRSLNRHQLKLQETKFEILTSEASYLNSLNILVRHFYTKIKNAQILKKDDIEMLFGQIEDVRDCSKKLLWDLERCWQNSVLLNNITDVIQKNLDDNFHIYISYCKNQMLIEELLQRLEKNDNFKKLVEQLEADPVCQSLSLYSFIMLPMQRITRWPLLIDAILKNFNSPNRNSNGDSEFKDFQKILINLNRLVAECNESAKKLEQERELQKIVQQLQFEKKVPVINLLAPNRFLVKYGCLQAKTDRKTDNTKFSLGTLGRKTSKMELYLFLFNDLLLVTRPKNDMFRIIHHCARNLLELDEESQVQNKNGKHLINLTLVENQDKKIIQLSLLCKNESDKERWFEVFKQSRIDTYSEVMYDKWDCPQVIAIYNHLPLEPDEIKLSIGEIINVFKKLIYGWYYGQKLSNGQTGWFPSNYTVEITNPHVIAENIKQRRRLLAATANYMNVT